MPDDQQWNSTQRVLWHFDSNVNENMINNTFFLFLRIWWDSKL